MFLCRHKLRVFLRLRVIASVVCVKIVSFAPNSNKQVLAFKLDNSMKVMFTACMTHICLVVVVLAVAYWLELVSSKVEVSQQRN